MFNHRYLVIEGNIGAGKTTLCELLQQDFNCRIILEAFADNPFLPFFYEDPERHAFSVELFFMSERHQQLKNLLVQDSLFEKGIVGDYWFMKTLLFARNNLQTEEFRLFQRFFHILNNDFPKPDLLVYLHRSVEDLQRNITNRGRTYEQSITAEYLQQIQQSYLDTFKQFPELPVLILDVDNSQFWTDKTDYQTIVQFINQSYPPGLNYRSLKA